MLEVVGLVGLLSAVGIRIPHGPDQKMWVLPSKTGEKTWFTHPEMVNFFANKVTLQVQFIY
jgi:hypothetical protein